MAASTQNRNIVAIGASAGGFEALRFLTKGLDKDLPASILITIHLPAEYRSSLDEILTRAGPLQASFAYNGQSIEKGRIYIAPPGRHLIVEGEQMWLGVGPRENWACPAIDPMLRSVAVCCGNRSIGVVLTGMLMDGAAGLWAIKSTGGATLVQDPADAAFPGMPAAALEQVKPDHVVRLNEITLLLNSLVRHPAAAPIKASDKLRYEIEIAKTGRASMSGMDWFGERSVLTCPECGGVLWQFKDGPLSRYRCHIGHAYGEERLALSLDEKISQSMAAALMALNERTALLGKLRDDATEAGRPELAKSWSRKAEEFEREAAVIGESIARLGRAAGRVGRPPL
jgi:two-component system, chemotaxis family, protein-glutamate methylesterase/glutaminase